MRTFLKMVHVVVAATVLSSCTTGYWADRGRDAADVFTVTIGGGLGAAARVGPVNLGLMKCMDGIGLRCGTFGELYEHSESNWCILLIDDRFTAPDAVDRGKAFAAVTCLAIIPEREPSPAKSSGGGSCGNINLNGINGEALCVIGAIVATVVAVIIITGSVCLPVEPRSLRYEEKKYSGHAPYFTQIEVAGGFWVVTRVGCNLGELADFLLGFFGVDIYDDDRH